MANDPRFEVFKQRHRSTVDEEGFAQMLPDQWGWRFRAANGQVVATAGEGFTREEDAERAVSDFTDAVTVLMTGHAEWALPPILRVDE